MIKKQIRRLHSFPECERSPFAKELVHEVSPGKAAKMGFSAPNADMSTTFIATSEVVKDNYHFVKVFNKSLKRMFELNKSDMKVLSYLMSSTKMGVDKVILPIKDCIITTKLSDSAIRRSIVILIFKGFIARTSTMNLYWINTTRFFRGDRMVLVEEYVRADRAAKDHPELPDKPISAMYAASPLTVVIPARATSDAEMSRDY